MTQYVTCPEEECEYCKHRKYMRINTERNKHFRLHDNIGANGVPEAKNKINSGKNKKAAYLAIGGEFPFDGNRKFNLRYMQYITFFGVCQEV